MAIVPWEIDPIRGGAWLASVTLTGDDSSDTLEVFDRPIQSVDVMGDFGDAGTVSIKGMNHPDSTPKSLHKADDSTETLDSMSTSQSEIIAILEVPRYLIAQAANVTTVSEGEGADDAGVTILVLCGDVRARY